uniref:BHLH domain-containing protein n=1 Tax=Strigamia maritima TaxID=126957 RepID=T1JCI1_STRMM
MTLPRLSSSYPQCMYDIGKDASFDAHGTVTSVSSTTDDGCGMQDANWDTSCEERDISLDNSEGATKKRSPKKGFKSVYKHVPHKDKPPHLVARRNARERRRVQAVNSAFAKLRKCVPVENRNKRLSKVKTLQKAIEYISHMQDMIDAADSHLQSTQTSQYGQENIQQTRWTSSVEMAYRDTEFEDYASFCDDFDDYAK